MGASLTINSLSEDTAKQIIEATGGGAKAIVDFVGAEASVNLGYQCLSKGGKQVVVGLFGGQMTIPLPLLTLTEKKLMGSYVGSLNEMRDLMKLVSTGKIESVEVESRDVSEATRTLDEMKSGKLQGLVSLTHK